MGDTTPVIDTSDLIKYIVLSIILATIVDIAMLLSGYNLRTQDTFNRALSIMVWGILRMYTPATSSMIILKSKGINPIKWLKERSALNLRGLLYYLLSPLIVLAALSIYTLINFILGYLTLENLINIINIPNISEASMLLVIIISAYTASITINALYAYGEEIGWRGFLQEGLINNTREIYSLILTGIIWGIWHIPAMILLGYNNVDLTNNISLNIFKIVTYIIFTVLLSISIGYMYQLTENILIPSSIHGSVNAFWNLTLLISRTDIVYITVLSLISWIPISLLISIIYKIRKIR